MEAGAEVRGATKFRGAMVILGSPSFTRVFRPPAVRPVVKVGESFDLRTVLAALSAERPFHILALSQNRTRILKCTAHGSEEMPYPEGFPASLASSMQTDQPDHTLRNQSTGGQKMGATGVMFGTSWDQDGKEDYLLHFFQEIDKAVNVAMKDSADPLVAFGVEHELALYRRVNTYRHLLDPGVTTARRTAWMRLRCIGALWNWWRATNRGGRYYPISTSA